MSRNDYIATKRDWENQPMPEKNTTFKLKMKLKKDDIARLKYGHIPREMEDKWFSYYEDDKLYIHRSWSGNCIYIVTFNTLTNRHKVIVNRNDNQYSCTDINEDIETLSDLLNTL